MRVLSLDIDYIMGPSIDLYERVWWEAHAPVRWQKLFDDTAFNGGDFKIDQGNLLFLFELFLQALRGGATASFSYDHDDILFALEGRGGIELLHVDHHDDVVCEDDFEQEASARLRRDWRHLGQQRVHEGNWVGWLQQQGQLKSFTWVANSNSNRDPNKDALLAELVPSFQRIEREALQPRDLGAWDHVFLCLSPQYVPPAHWHVMSLFLLAYEGMSGKRVELDRLGRFKYEHVRRHQPVSEQLAWGLGRSLPSAPAA